MLETGAKGDILEEKMVEFNNRSDEGAVMESHDVFDHGVCPMDPNTMDYQKN